MKKLFGQRLAVPSVPEARQVALCGGMLLRDALCSSQDHK